jgi:hypothetical protein
MLMEASARGKSMQTAFVPYRPLNAAYTPQRTIPVNTAQPYNADDKLYKCFVELAEQGAKHGFTVNMPPKYEPPAPQSGILGASVVPPIPKYGNPAIAAAAAAGAAAMEAAKMGIPQAPQPPSW